MSPDNQEENKLDHQQNPDLKNNNVSGWKSFILKTWHPIPTIFSTIVLFLCMGIIFLIFGIVLNVINSSIIESVNRYDNNSKCQTTGVGSSCEITIEIKEKMNKPVFVFYELHNFYQNHRRYIKSKSSTQLSGKVISQSNAQQFCDPVWSNKQMGKTKSVSGTSLDQDDVSYPCGLIAKSFFTDKYSITKSGGSAISINENGISWPNDVGNKFKNLNDWKTKQWINVEDEHFVVWMRTAGLPDFRKVWGKIDQDLDKGTYIITIKDMTDVKPYNGKKFFVLSTSGPFGGKNKFLEVAYFIIGSICIVIAMIFAIKKYLIDKKPKNQ